MKRPPSTPYKAKLASGPLSVRVFWRERTGGWYVGASFEPVDLPWPEPSRLMLGVDINPDHLAWSLVNRSGNPTTWGKIVLSLTGEAHHDADAIGVAVAGLVAIAKSEGAAIAHEDLDFSRSRAGLRYLPRRLARLLSSFSYNQILTTLASRCASYGVRHVPVNPAWTSVLGQANYAGVHGVSVDQGAACVIARRALGFSSRLRPAVAWALPGAKRPSRIGRKPPVGTCINFAGRRRRWGSAVPPGTVVGCA
ncbi:transposase, IS605 family, OrfA and OrfB [mine drainage metagenome]|uniref:Transposase, IS605 family, OrfA and OrfB n=1 Tax=mine drainage metagenome TaxID=410659 RepID=T1B2L0_9ZZZZ